ncbi:MAG: tRNA pseudouridine(38-40) synthase TruA [Lachnospiraceae bacterium]|nr:tRNA pseudouridine(38-40) synthase TruA [Lachnospiraceae bacterium]
MRNIRLVIEYDGSRYDGWQVNKQYAKKPSIQEKIEEVLAKMLGKETELIGALRTESGVHAYEQVANFKAETDMKPFEIKHYLNRYLPMDIAVYRVDDVPVDFHAGFNAKGFVYEYKVSLSEVPSVFERKYCYHLFKKPDIESMKKASKFILGKQDFKVFSDNKRMKKSTVRDIRRIDIYADNNEMAITIEADDFWPNMARIIIGTLLDVGSGKIKAEDIKSIIDSKDREKAGEIAEAKGLFLREVMYQ